MFKQYNMNQVILPMDIEMKLQENDIAYAVHELVESIPGEAFSEFLRDTGCPAYHPRMMMKVVLCAYTQSVFSGRKIEANANKFTFVWRKAVEKYSASLIEKSNRMYDELIEKEVIPEIKRETPEELSVEELSTITETLEEKVEEFTQKIEESDDVSVRKQMRSQRKEPKQAHKQFKDFVARKQKYERDMEIFDERNSYSKTDHECDVYADER